MSSLTDMFYLDVAHVRIAEAHCGRGLNITGHPTDRRKIAFLSPFLQTFERDGINRDRIFARINRVVVDGEVRLRLRPASVLRNEPVHHVEYDFLRDDRIGT